MRWLKRNLGNAGIVMIGTLLLLLFTAWMPISAAGIHEEASGADMSETIMVQTTPTEDATVTALNKEKLKQEVTQLRQANDRSFSQWLWVYGSTLFSTLAVVGGGTFALIRWLDDRQKERKKQDEERLADLQKQEKEQFESISSAISGLGDEKEGTRVGAAIMLRTIFLRPGYERFYAQIFDLAVAHLRLSRASAPLEDPIHPLTPLERALIMVFIEAFPLARRQIEESSQSVLDRQERYQYQDVTGIRSLDATGIQLDNAYMREADLKQVWMPEASLRKADLKGATLSEAHLYKANLSETKLTGANLSKANLIRTDLFKTWLRLANLSEAKLKGAKLHMVNFDEANLERADLSHAILTGTNLEMAQSLKDANLRGIKGLTKEQLEACKAKGAIINKDPATSSSQPGLHE